MKTLLHSLWSLALMTVLLGLAYPLVMTGIAQLAVPGPANGSLVRNGQGAVVGSALIGQDWPSPAWFRGRPSATGDHPYNPQASGGSNLSPQGQAYADRVAADLKAWKALAAAAGQNEPVPNVLLTTSGSGLDPDLDLEAALWQVPLVAHARNADPDQVAQVVRAAAEPIGWPWDPPPMVNLLAVNLALDQKFPKP